MVTAPDKVEEIFTVTLSTLADPDTLRTVLWSRDGHEYEVPVFAVDAPTPRNIWGATAAMTGALLARLGWRGYWR